MTCYPVKVGTSGGYDSWSELAVNRVLPACKRVLNDEEEEIEACIWTPPGAAVTDGNDSDNDEKVTGNDAKEDETDETLIMIIIAISVGCSAIIVVTLIGLLICYMRKTCCFKKNDKHTVRVELPHGNFEFRA